MKYFYYDKLELKYKYGNKSANFGKQLRDKCNVFTALEFNVVI